MTKPLPARRPRRAIYLLPNLFTTAALMGGFSAILLALDGRFKEAAIAVFVAMVLDTMDGRVARMTNTASPFGAEYDSLADVISFGLAPAISVYLWALKGLGPMTSWPGRLGWLVAFCYCLFAALRLARFNVHIGKVDKRFFVGLPSPAAAAIVMGFIWVGADLGIKGQQLPWIALLITLFAGGMMVSNVLFFSFKTIDFLKKVKFIVLLAVLLVGGIVLADPPKFLFMAFFAYGLSGPIHWGVRRWRRSKVAA